MAQGQNYNDTEYLRHEATSTCIYKNWNSGKGSLEALTCGRALQTDNMIK